MKLGTYQAEGIAKVGVVDAELGRLFDLAGAAERAVAATRDSRFIAAQVDASDQGAVEPGDMGDVEQRMVVLPQPLCGLHVAAGPEGALDQRGHDRRVLRLFEHQGRQSAVWDGGVFGHVRASRTGLGF